MGASVKQVYERYIGEAMANPKARPQIFRKAAYELMGLAQNPKNARVAKSLASIGMQFAEASRERQQRVPVMDDLADLMHETALAYQEVGDDPMDLVARRREIHDDRTPRVPGNVSIAPESFNRDATLGRSAEIKFNPTQEDIKAGILQSQNVAFWQGTKKEAQAFTVDANLGAQPQIQLIDGGGIPLGARPYVELEYGSDGNRTKVKFDLGFGTRCTAVGNYCAVTLGMDNPGAGIDSATIKVGASIGAFAAPSQAPLISTIYLDLLDGPGNSDLIPLPLKSVLLLPIQTSLLVGDHAELQFFDYGGNRITTVYYQQGYNVSLQPIPIPADAGFIRVHNTDTTANFRLPFQLSL